MQSPHLPYWLAAVYLPNIGPRRILRWLEHFEHIEALFQASQNELLAAGLNPKQIAAIKQTPWEMVEKDVAWADKPLHHIITLADPAYPARLKEIPDPPLVLYLRGNPTCLTYPQLAIVGSRHATPAGLQNAEQFAYTLAEAGLAITSGLALGIDGASHSGALRAKGITLGVAGTGLNFLYPRKNSSLAEAMIANDGAVISEFPLATPPIAMNFPRRNRIISGLSLGVLVIEAALKSGSLITAKHALEQNREVFAIPGSIHHPLARGCHHLIRQGAKLVETAQDILEELQIETPPAPTPSRTNIPAEFRQIFDHIGREITPIDMIILQSGLTPSEVSSILLKLELQGCIESTAGGYRRTAQD